MHSEYDFFGELHPIVTFIYFAAAMLFAMLGFNPICLTAALLGALIYFAAVRGIKAMFLRLLTVIPVFLLTALINPTFNHRGATVITYFHSGNPLTAESVFFGFAAGEMLAAVLLWFDCFNKTVTTDKIVYIFGRIVPGGSLLISMTLRFVPRLSAKFGEIVQAQKSIGNDIHSKNIVKRLSSFLGAFSVLVNHMLEGSIRISDSMQSRGYGTGRRTDYTIFRFTAYDGIVLSGVLLLALAVSFCFASGFFTFDYYPVVKNGRQNIFAYLCFALYYTIPFAINIKEEISWRLLRSKV
ncbi:MAG: energy-coupling factor transporter transmembrane protein EcfT [Firmicutes bacterium]|nr:energy-coupling factor transporter transmembrane protein EcfT [Bacillota bacterium]